MPDYCNITTDLKRAFARIDEYQRRVIVEDWKSAGSNVYLKLGTGYVDNVWVDDVAYTADTDNTPDAGKYYYGADVDTLYIHITGDGDPADNDILVGEDWDGLKTAMRDKAQQIIDARLNNKYETPLSPRSRQTHDTADYEYDVVRATALCTCWLIVSRDDPGSDDALNLHRAFENTDPEYPKGILNQLMDGDIVLQDQVSVREVGSWNIYPWSSNTIGVNPVLSGTYEGSYYRIWRVQIDTAGAPGTGTYKVSYDGGTNWDLTLQDMKDADKDQYRMYIASGIYIYWPVQTYVESEYWDIELHPLSDTAENAKIGSIRLVR